MENRLRDCQTNHYEDQTMRAILAHFKRILRQLESISSNHYDGLVMQMMGGF
jgi:hypothetical protein